MTRFRHYCHQAIQIRASCNTRKMKKILVVLLAVFAYLSVSVGAVSAMTDTELLSSINAARSNADLAKMSLGTKLEKAAHMKLQDIQKYKYWNHNNPVTGEVWWKVVYKAGVRGRAAENQARGYTDSSVVVAGWDNSPAHHVNLFSEVYKKVGLAVGEVEYPEGKKTVVVAVFGE